MVYHAAVVGISLRLTMDRSRTWTSLGRWLGSVLLTALFAAQIHLAHAEPDPPFVLPARAELLKLRSAAIETSRGTLFFELLPEEAPWHVANFKYLADKQFYNGLRFHLYEPGYLIQGGDPKGTGFGGPGYSLPPEFSPRDHKFGTLGMARKPDAYNRKKQLINPERRSSGSQFHILLGDAPHMDGRYTVFGKLVGGAAVLSQLRANDTIKKITVYVREGGR
jgi:peptidyl-prolyl cis-trans isomerase B (cyclophilin B)